MLQSNSDSGLWCLAPAVSWTLRQKAVVISKLYHPGSVCVHPSIPWSSSRSQDQHTCHIDKEWGLLITPVGISQSTTDTVTSEETIHLPVKGECIDYGYRKRSKRWYGDNSWLFFFLKIHPVFHQHRQKRASNPRLRVQTSALINAMKIRLDILSISK